MECVQHVLQKQINKIVIMLSPRLTNCPECANIPSLLKKIDCKLAELGNNLYNNISYMLNKPVPADDITQLIGYRRILMYKLCNPSYVQEYTIPMISSKVIRLTVGCISRCSTPEPCIEEPCDVTIVPNPTSTTTSTSTTLVPTTTTTSSSSTSTSTSSSTTTTTTTVINSFCYTITSEGPFRYSYILPDGSSSGSFYPPGGSVTFCAQENSALFYSTAPSCPPICPAVTITGGTSICLNDGDCTPSTTTTTTLVPTTTTTSTTVISCCNPPTKLALPGSTVLLDGVNLTFSSTKPAGLMVWPFSVVMRLECIPDEVMLGNIFTSGNNGEVDWDYTINFDQPVNDVKIQIISYSANSVPGFQQDEKITFTTNTQVPEVINCDACNVIIENNSIRAVMNTDGSGTFIISTTTPYTSLTLTPSMLGPNPGGYAVSVFLRICGLTI